ncbi:hypothetical protein TNCV_1976241 [Trichonephila clavipes]|nr:hypothetical protein TNCV_1976241 [Trichonephila clavipes]
MLRFFLIQCQGHHCGGSGSGSSEDRTRDLWILSQRSKFLVLLQNPMPEDFRSFVYVYFRLRYASDLRNILDDDNVCTAPIMAYKNILEFVHSSKTIADADSYDEKGMHNADHII